MSQKAESPYSVMLGSDRAYLEAGSAIAGEQRSEFTRRAIRERAKRVLQENRDRRKGQRTDC